MTELRAVCMGTAPHAEHTFNAGQWCPGLLDPDLVTYELRPGSTWLKMPVLTLAAGPDGERFAQAVEIAEKLSMGRWNIWRLAPARSLRSDGTQRTEEHYIVSSGPYWMDPEGSLHQILSSGACWDCYQKTCQAVRHPVTPGEVLTGELLPAKMHDDDPCPGCGGGYRYWIIGGPEPCFDYVEHRQGCQVLSGEKTREDFS